MEKEKFHLHNKMTKSPGAETLSSGPRQVNPLLPPIIKEKGIEEEVERV